MGSVDTVKDALFACEYSVPDAKLPLHDVVSRWSDTYIEKPAMIVVPGSEKDVLDVINYARANGLRVMPTNGAHGNFAPLDARTIYLDTKKFDSMELDKEAGALKLGGGVIVRQVIKYITEQGYFTGWPNSNAVGMTGFTLGGGATFLAGLYGYMVDNVLGFRIITADGETRDVSPSSLGDDLKLFNVLCGSGHGFGVITSITLKAWPITDLGLTEGKLWARTLIFPASQFETAVKTYFALGDPAPAMQYVMVYRCAPSPASPKPVPVIIIAATCVGPSELGESLSKPLFDEEVVSKTIAARTALTPLVSANDLFEPVNYHGGFKIIASIFIEEVRLEALTEGFQKFLKLTQETEGTTGSQAVHTKWNVDKIAALGKTAEGAARFISNRDRGNVIIAHTEGPTAEMEETLLEDWRENFLSGYRKEDKGRPEGFMNNYRHKMDLKELHPEERVAELKSLKKKWDADNMFWSPYGEKWAK